MWYENYPLANGKSQTSIFCLFVFSTHECCYPLQIVENDEINSSHRNNRIVFNRFFCVCVLFAAVLIHFWMEKNEDVFAGGSSGEWYEKNPMATGSIAAAAVIVLGVLIITYCVCRNKKKRSRLSALRHVPHQDTDCFVNVAPFGITRRNSCLLQSQ